MKTYNNGADNATKMSVCCRAIRGAEMIEGGHVAATVAVVALLEKVSTSTVRAALRLTPAERAEVRAGKRPLVVRKPNTVTRSAPLTPVAVARWWIADASEADRIQVGHLIGIAPDWRDWPAAAGEANAAHA